MKTNPELTKIIKELKTVSIKNNVKIWKKVATELEKPTRKRRHVNLYKIEKLTKDGETIIVPGKVLGTGELTKQVKVAAWEFSEQAQSKIKDQLTIQNLIKENPKGRNIKIIC
jgi:large subunit ribosomal protein L18e